ncbi:MAG: hypothetical protein NW217_15030 [Hyphomicrobiaceae bacterium]|nr:hypothetical protein [Hyphomicrobiaceae bacterium]
MALKASQKAVAIQAVGILQAVTGRSPASEGQLDTFVTKFQDLGRAGFITFVTKTAGFKAKYGANDASLNERKLILDIFKNLGLNPPSQSLVNNFSKAFANDADLLLSKVLALASVANKLKVLATPFVEKALEAPQAAPYGENLNGVDYNDAPTGINLGQAQLIVNENALPGTILAPLVAVDADAGDTHTFEITAGGTFFEVVITQAGAALAYKGGADVPTDATIPVSIKVTDAAGESTTVTVNVLVNDVPAVLPPIATIPGAVVTGDDADNLFTAAVDSISGINTLSGAHIDGQGGDDTLKVLVASTDKSGPAVIPKVEIDEVKGSDVVDGGDAFFVGNFTSTSVETFEVSQVGENDVAFGLGGMGTDLARIVSNSAEAKNLYFLNIAEANGLRAEINHTTADHVFDFKHGSIDGTETVTVAVDGAGKTIEPLPFDPKHPDQEDKRDPGEKGIDLAFTEGLNGGKGKLANLQRLNLEFNGKESVIRTIEAGVVVDKYGHVIDGLETISGRGTADAVVGSFEAPLFETNPYLQTVDMSATSGDNAYVIAWPGERGTIYASVSGHEGNYDAIEGGPLWKVPVYDIHGKLVSFKPLSFIGGSGDEKVYLGFGAVNLTANGGAGVDEAIFADLPVGSGNSFTNFEVAKIYAKVGGPAPFTGDPTDGDTDIFDASAVAGIYNIEFSCGVECFEPAKEPWHFCCDDMGDDWKTPVELTDGIDPHVYDTSRPDFVSESNLALINLEANKAYTFTFKDGEKRGSDDEYTPSSSSSEYEHPLPRYWGEPRQRDGFTPLREGKALNLVVDVGILDTEGNTNAGDGTADELTLVLEQDLDINLVAGETEILNVDGATKDGNGRHHITFVKADVEETATPVTMLDKNKVEVPVLDSHLNPVIAYENEIKKQVEINEDLTTINLTGEADYFAITGDAKFLTPKLTLIDATGTEGDTRLFVDGVGSQTEGLEVRGTANDDIIRGTEAGDLLKGNDGDDELFGKGGDDDLQGGNGSDYIVGGAGADRIDGGDGADHMIGGGSTDEVWRINIEGKIGHGDNYGVHVYIDRGGLHPDDAKVLTITTFDIYKFHDWAKGCYIEEHGSDTGFSAWYHGLDSHTSDYLKLQFLQKEIAYKINKAIEDLAEKDHKYYGIDDEVKAYINEHKELVVVNKHGLDLEFHGSAGDDIYKEDHPEQAILTIHKGHYDVGDVIKVDLISDGLVPDNGFYKLEITSGLDTNGDHKIDEEEVAAGLAQAISDAAPDGFLQSVVADGKNVVITGKKGGDFTSIGDVDLVNKRAQLSADYLPKDITLKLGTFSISLDLEDLDGDPSEADQGVIAQIVNALGLGFDPDEVSNYDDNGVGVYVFKGNASEEVVATVRIEFKDGKGSIEILGPESGDPFPNNGAAQAAIIEYIDDKGKKQTIEVEKHLDVNHNSDPKVENTVNDNSEGISFDELHDGQIDQSDLFIVSEENPILVYEHPAKYKNGDERKALDVIKDFVTFKAEKTQDDHLKVELFADKIDFEGFNDAGPGNFTDASAFFPSGSVPTVFADYMNAVNAASLTFVATGTTYVSASYNDDLDFDGVFEAGEISTAVFAFDKSDAGAELNKPDTAVILIGIGPGQVTADDIVA